MFRSFFDAGAEAAIPKLAAFKTQEPSGCKGIYSGWEGRGTYFYKGLYRVMEGYLGFHIGSL